MLSVSILNDKHKDEILKKNGNQSLLDYDVINSQNVELHDHHRFV